MGSKARAVVSSEERPWATRDFLLPALVVLLAAGMMGSMLEMSAVHPHSLWKLASKLLWKNASVRPPMLLTLTFVGWAGVMRVCRAAGMNVDFVLGGPTAPPAAILHAAFVLLAAVMCAHAVHIYASETPGLTWRPWLTCNLLLHMTVLGLAVWPRGLAYASRASLISTLIESVIAPFAPVTFWHVIVADYLTSMAKAFSDLQITACLASHIFAHDAAAVDAGA